VLHRSARDQNVFGVRGARSQHILLVNNDLTYAQRQRASRRMSPLGAVIVAGNVRKPLLSDQPFAMPQISARAPCPTRRKSKRPSQKTGPTAAIWFICWNDPVNLMDYVTHVFPGRLWLAKAKAEKHMLQVHQTGQSPARARDHSKRRNITSINCRATACTRRWSVKR